MVTKEWNADKKCCFYASDFHLEMILLPYIKNKIAESEFVIFTQNDLSDTIKILLDRVNISNEDKEKILNINWTNENKEKIEYARNLSKNDKTLNIIISGKYEYITKVNKEIASLNNNNIQILDCFSMEDKNIDIKEIKNQYKEIINTNKI